MAMKHQFSSAYLVYDSYSDLQKLQKMYYINHIDSFSIHAHVCAQKSFKRTSSGFDLVTPMTRKSIFTHDAVVFDSFEADYQSKAVPSALLSLVSLMLQLHKVL